MSRSFDRLETTVREGFQEARYFFRWIVGIYAVTACVVFALLAAA